MSNPNPDPNENEPTETMDAERARRVEQEKLTRRAALRKLGFGAGLAAFSLLGVDDFARMVGKRMERMAGDNKVAGQIAKEFQSAGIALADPISSGDPCTDCCTHYCNSYNDCFQSYCICISNGGTPASCEPALNTCENNADYAFGGPQGCYAQHCGSTPCPKCIVRNCDNPVNPGA